MAIIPYGVTIPTDLELARKWLERCPEGAGVSVLHSRTGPTSRYFGMYTPEHPTGEDCHILYKPHSKHGFTNKVREMFNEFSHRVCFLYLGTYVEDKLQFKGHSITYEAKIPTNRRHHIPEAAVMVMFSDPRQAKEAFNLVRDAPSAYKCFIQYWVIHYLVHERKVI